MSSNDKEMAGVSDTSVSKYINVVCSNCGTRGHILRECTKPITSFGIIAYKIVREPEYETLDKNDKLESIIQNNPNKLYRVPTDSQFPKFKLLLIQRKDTIGYTDFIRGKYPDKDDLGVYFSEMTVEEQERLLTSTFEDLWDSLWVNHGSKIYKNEYWISRKKFEACDVPELVKKFPAKFSFQEFGFPKGRKNLYEGDLECAMREFTEETGYTNQEYKFTGQKILEEFIGTDNIHYKHVYYVAEMNQDCRPAVFDTSNKYQLGEISNIGWFDYIEVISLIRPYDTEKKKIVRSFMRTLVGSKQFRESEGNKGTSFANFRKRLPIAYPQN